MLDRKVRNIDLGARAETFKYPPHLAQEGRSEGLLGHVRRIKYWWLDLSRALCGAGLFLQKSDGGRLKYFKDQVRHSLGSVGCTVGRL